MSDIIKENNMNYRETDYFWNIIEKRLNFKVWFEELKNLFGEKYNSIIDESMEIF